MASVTKKQYPPEYKAEVVAAYRQGGTTYAQVARDFGGTITAETVRSWVASARKSEEGRTGEARDATRRAKERELERRVRELEEENAFLKKCSAFFAREYR